MKCPECLAPLREGVPACPKCAVTLDDVRGVGRMPTIKGVVTDVSRVLNRIQTSKIRAEIRRFVRQFPQLHFHVLLTKVDPDVALGKFAFWVFNHAAICSTLEKGGLNFQILLVIDTDTCRANLSIGYGLEPFVSEAHLQGILQAGEEALRNQAFGEATLEILSNATEVLHRIGDLIPQTYGMRARSRPHEF